MFAIFSSDRPFTASRFSSAACTLSLILFAGCSGGGQYEEVTTKDVEQAESHVHEHEHHHEAPHGGHLIELGDHQYVAEVVFKADVKELDVYLYDAHAENAVPVPLEQIEFAVEGGSPIVLTANPQEGDPAGQSSRFTASGDAVTVDDVEGLHGGLTIEIDDASYTGELSHDHDHEGHEHADHAHE